MRKPLISAAILLAFGINAIPQSAVVLSSVTATFASPNDTLSASWTDSPSNGRQIWAVFAPSGARIASGTVAQSSSGAYSVKATFTAPTPNQIMFQVCDNLACKNGSYFTPSAGTAPASYVAKFTEIIVTSDAVAILPWTCQIPEFLTTTDVIAASVSSNSFALSENISDAEALTDSLSARLDAQCAISDSLAQSDAVGFAFAVLFPQGCVLTLSGQTAVCSTP